jgi:hypothetical protein
MVVLCRDYAVFVRELVGVCSVCGASVVSSKSRVDAGTFGGPKSTHARIMSVFLSIANREVVSRAQN